MTVICFNCKKECNDYEFKNIGGDIRPVCTICTGRQKIMQDLADVHSVAFERNFKGEPTLEKWIK